MHYNKSKLISLLPYFFLAIAIIVVYKIINELSFFVAIMKRIWSIITPFFYGFLLAYIINIPCSGIEKLLGKTSFKLINKRKKGLSVVLVYILFALIIYSVLNLVIPTIYQSISLFIANLPQYYDDTLKYVDYVNNLELGIEISREEVLTSLQGMFQRLSAENIATPLNAIFGVSSAIFTSFLAFVSSIYFLLEKEKSIAYLCRLLKALSPSGIYNGTMKYAGRLNNNFKQYIKTQTLDGFILGSIATFELYCFRSPYFLILGIMLGIINYIPYFGSIIGSFIAIIVVAFTQGIKTAAVLSVILLITQQLDGNVIQPRLMGDSFKLSPLLVIVSITVGGAFYGVLGMIAAIPIVAILKDMLESILDYYEHQKLKLPDDPDDDPGGGTDDPGGKPK